MCASQVYGIHDVTCCVSIELTCAPQVGFVSYRLVSMDSDVSSFQRPLGAETCLASLPFLPQEKEMVTMDPVQVMALSLKHGHSPRSRMHLVAGMFVLHTPHPRLQDCRIYGEGTCPPVTTLKMAGVRPSTL